MEMWCVVRKEPVERKERLKDAVRGRLKEAVERKNAVTRGRTWGVGDAIEMTRVGDKRQRKQQTTNDVNATFARKCNAIHVLPAFRLLATVLLLVLVGLGLARGGLELLGAECQ
jgi:hypothetical protein